MKRIFLTTIWVIFATFLVAQTNDYPVKMIDGRDYYEYTVEPREGLFAVARKFGVSQADLQAANANLSDGLRAGQVIYVPIVQQVNKTDDNVIVHKVQPKQTLYSLSKKYNVSIDAIIDSNQFLLTDGLRVGQDLRIPIVPVLAENQQVVAEQPAASELQNEPADTTQRTHIVQRRETLYSISKQYDVKVDEIIAANNLTTNIRVGMELIIPQNVVDTVAQISDNQENEQVATTQNPIKIGVLLPFMLKTPYIDASVNFFWEFYRGVLVGLENVKAAGISVELYTYDIAKDLRVLDSVLLLPELRQMDMLIGPAYANQVAQVADYAQRNKIYTLVPFTSKIGDDVNEYLLPFNPSQDRILPYVARAFVKRFATQQFVIARVNEKQDKANRFADELTKALHASLRPYKEFTLTENNVDTLLSLVGRTRSVLLIATPQAEFASKVLPKIETLNLPFLQIIGFEDWERWTRFYDGTYYYSLFNRKTCQQYEDRYEHWFGEHTLSTDPDYDLIGYDVINFLCRALDKNRENPTLAFDRVEQQPLQSHLKFVRKKNDVWFNTNWYLFGYYNKELKVIK